jgi:hypothetical protein
MKQSQVLALLGSIAVATLLSAFCASAGAQSSVAGEPAVCIDTPPYDTVPYEAEKFISVAPGVNLEVLDWGGSGETMVLLTGSGDNAHVYDYFAFQFTDFFRVIGITRRGWLPSSQPENGYDVETRAADDIKVLDALGINKAVFVGHSISGSELSKIAVKYPSYVDKLVYATLLTCRYPDHLLCLLTLTVNPYLLCKRPMHGCWRHANQSRRPACPMRLTKMEELRGPRHRNPSRLNLMQVCVLRQIRQRTGRMSRSRGSAFSRHRLLRANYPGTRT